MNKLLTYCCTKQHFTNHWNGDVFSNAFYLSDSELKRFNVSRVKFEAIPNIKEVGYNQYNVIDFDKIDVSLLRPGGQPLTDLHKWMLQRVCETELPNNIETTQYWNTFLKHRERFPELFFKVDSFSGRVHSPISGMSKTIRPFLILRNEKTTSLDVATMQPTLLGNILTQAVGENSFSQAINDGIDVYSMLQSKAGLKSRDEAKKLFFEILFGRPNDKLSKLFDGANFIQWINKYKSENEPRNPHGKSKQYSNLAWLLQSYEVQIMGKIWRTLAQNAIPFVTVHDEIIVQQTSLKQATEIMNNELSKHFINFKINSK